MIQQVEKWDFYEVVLEGPESGNPFINVELKGIFSKKGRSIEVEGFYDGQGVYKIRFMPDTIGEWSYQTVSNFQELDGKEGEFTCVEAGNKNHGPVRVSNKYHFCYEDGTKYMPVGTTCYAWIHQGDKLEEKTLATLEKAPFNKIRMCVFPKDYNFNKNEPKLYPFAGDLEQGWDYTRFNPEFFRHLEKRIDDLRQLNIEADIIIFHPYDRWGFARMKSEVNERYIKYLLARLSAYRNIWWSMANEYDLMEDRDLIDWDRYFHLVQEYDPYQHLRSIHNCRQFYDHGQPWVTHASIQNSYLERTAMWREQFGKPVVVDECCYEGNINRGWGNITAEEMVRRFWEGFTRGGYVGHGETYMHPEDILWWAKGGELHGDSPARIGFLKDIIDDLGYLDPIDFNSDVACAGRKGKVYLLYHGIKRPSFRILNLPDDKEFTVDIIDTWNMTINREEGTFSGNCRIELPGRQYMALLVKEVE